MISIDVYKCDIIGFYLMGQQQIDSVMLEVFGCEDYDEQFGWYGIWQMVVGWEFIDGYWIMFLYGIGFFVFFFGQQYGVECFGIVFNLNLKLEELK